MHQAPSPHQQGSQDSPFADIDWRGILASVILIILVIAIGPLTLALTWGIRAWCVRSRLDAADRWDSMRVFAWLFGMLTILAILAFFFFPVQALHVWTISPFSHLGAPDLLHNFWLRWTLSLPLACVLAFVLEEGDPRTIHQFSRFQTAAERKETDRQRAEQQAAQDLTPAPPLVGRTSPPQLGTARTTHSQENRAMSEARARSALGENKFRRMTVACPSLFSQF